MEKNLFSLVIKTARSGLLFSCYLNSQTVCLVDLIKRYQSSLSAMSRQAFLALVVLLLVNGSTYARRDSDVRKAKDIMDSLSKKLHNDIKELKESIEEAKKKINKTVERLVIVKKIQLLLARLSNQPVPGKMCEPRYIVPDFHYKKAILIQMKSALPSLYTATVKGKSHWFFYDTSLSRLFPQVFSFKVQTPKETFRVIRRKVPLVISILFI